MLQYKIRLRLKTSVGVNQGGERETDHTHRHRDVKGLDLFWEQRGHTVEQEPEAGH